MANLLGYLQRNARQQLMNSFEGNKTPRQGSQLYTDMEWRRPSPLTVEDVRHFRVFTYNSYSAKDFGPHTHTSDHQLHWRVHSPIPSDCFEEGASSQGNNYRWQGWPPSIHHFFKYKKRKKNYRDPAWSSSWYTVRHLSRVPQMVRNWFSWDGRQMRTLCWKFSCLK